MQILSYFSDKNISYYVSFHHKFSCHVFLGNFFVYAKVFHIEFSHCLMEIFHIFPVFTIADFLLISLFPLKTICYREFFYNIVAWHLSLSLLGILSVTRFCHGFSRCSDIEFSFPVANFPIRLHIRCTFCRATSVETPIHRAAFVMKRERKEKKKDIEIKEKETDNISANKI